MYYFNYLSIIIAVVALLCAVYVYYAKKELIEARFLSYFIIFASLWMSTVSMADFARTEEGALLWIKLSNIYGMLGVLFLLFFISIFRDINTKIIKKNFVLIVLVFFSSLLNFVVHDDFIYSNIKVFEHQPPEGTMGAYYYYYVILISVLFVKSIYILFHNYEKLSLKRKLQINYVIAGASISVVGGIICNVILPLAGEERFYGLGTSFYIFFIGFASYAVVKHQLLDIKIVIQKSIIYSSLLAIIIGFYLCVVAFFSLFVKELSSLTALAAGILTTVLGIYGAPIIEAYFRRVTDKIFFKDKYDYSTALYEMSEILNRNLDIKILHKKIERQLNIILKVKFVNLLICGETEEYSEHNRKFILNNLFIEFIEETAGGVLSIYEFESILSKIQNSQSVMKELGVLNNIYKNCVDNNIEVLISIKHDMSFLGIVALGQKLSGEMYSRDDMNLLKTVSSQAAVAFEKAQLFEQVNNYSKDLQKKVIQRTKKIKDMQEHQKQMMLEIAHGLQTPLTIIRGKLETLPEVARKNMKVKSLDQSIDRISKFIYDMLRLSNLESGEKQISLVKIDLSDLMAELVESFEIIAVEKEIKINSDIAPNIFILGDRNEIADLITNLVSNGTKYMKETGEKIINISLQDKNDKIEISVSDNGIGIDNKHIPYLFSRFHRIEDESHAKSKGTGLGLAICKKIVERHAGKIGVKSKSGQGSIFIVEIPKAKIE